MYSEKLKASKIDIEFDGRVILGGDVSRDRLKEIVAGFCTKEDLHLVPQKRVLDLFDEYCRENGYPLFKRKAVGQVLREVFGVTSTVARVDGEVIRIYV